MKLSLRTGAGLASLLLVLFVAGTMARNGLVQRPPPPVARQASQSDPPPLSVQPLLRDVEATRQPVDVCGSVTSRATLFAFPFRPRAGERVRLIAISRARLAPFTAEVVGEAAGPSGLEAVDAWGPGPYAWEFAAGGLAAGEYAVLLRQRGEPAPLGCATLRIDPAGGPRERVAENPAVWPIRREWNGALEDLYSAWVSRLFRVSEGSHGGWRRLQAVFRSTERNVLHDALGWGEDDSAPHRPDRPAAIRARADCGDLPYMLRAYFAWKLELPFRFQRCNRGNALVGADCYEESSNLTDRFADVVDPVERFNRFVETSVASSVHSATPRTLPEDDASDFYPVEMTRAALRPGTVYVWPYGHLLVISDWQEDEANGLSLVAVDGHPDGTVTFKRFSPRNFPYLPGLRTAGFKAFRPVIYALGEVVPVDNAGLASYQTPLLFSEEQYRFRRSGDFYRAVQQVSSLFPLEPPGG